MLKPFVEELGERFSLGRHLCVGIDPHPRLLTDWGLTPDAVGAEKFGAAIVRAAAPWAACVKVQVGLFECFGAAGYSALERIFARARAAEVPVIADVKRGDIASSMLGYARAWLSVDSPLNADAMTVHPYHGYESLRPAIDLARQAGKIVFVLAATSNSEASLLQGAKLALDAPLPAADTSDDASAVPSKTDCTRSHSTVAASIFQSIAAEPPAKEMGITNVGAVLGATVNPKDLEIETGRLANRVVVLAPGFGVQGGLLPHVRDRFGVLWRDLLVSESRSLLQGDPNSFGDRVRQRAQEVAWAFAKDLL